MKMSREESLDRLRRLRNAVSHYRSGKPFDKGRIDIPTEDIFLAWESGIATSGWVYKVSEEPDLHCVICDYMMHDVNTMWRHIKSGAHKDAELLLKLSI